MGKLILFVKELVFICKNRYYPICSGIMIQMKWIDTQISGTVVRIAFDADSIHIFDAYPIKDDLKKEGFRWNPDDKSWVLKGQDPQVVLAKLSPAESESHNQFVPDEPMKSLNKPLDEEVEKGFTIAQLRDRIESLLNRYMFEPIWVRGVIVSEVKQYRWASYFDLGDEESTSSFFFRVELPAERLGPIEKALAELGVAKNLEKDLPVMLKVSLSLAQRYVVDVRLNVLDILPEYTQSKLRNQREITLELLRKEGILEQQRQLLLPRMINRVGLITSSQGTSIEDIRSAMAPHAGRFQILFCDARMEGALAVPSIVTAIRRLSRLKEPLDLIVLARGGGSEQSLAVFNDVRICREICLAPVPILAAIGHEKDISAAELCAHIMPSPSTPSGAGKFLAQRYQLLLDSLHKLVSTWLIFGQRFVEGERRTLQARLSHLPQLLVRRQNWERAQLARQLRLCDARRMLSRNAEMEVDLRRDISDLFSSGRRLFKLVLERVKNHNDMIAAHSPDRVLKRGFTLLFDDKGRVMGDKRAFMVKKGGTLRFHDGEAVITAGESCDQN